MGRKANTPNDNAGSQDSDIAGAGPEETQGSATSPEDAPVPDAEKKEGPVTLPILTQEDAAAWFAQEGYVAPDHVRFAIVTQDGNVFWPENQSAAQNHAFKNNLKFFRLDGFK